MGVALIVLLLGTPLQIVESVDPIALEWFRKGEELIGTAKENSQEQASYFEEAVAHAPNFAVARYNLALVYIRQARLQQATNQLDSLIEFDGTNPRGYLLRARLRFEANQLDLAVSDLTHILTLNPENYQALQFMGRIYHQKQQYMEAVEAFEKVLEINSRSSEVFFELALSQQALGQREEAIKSYQQFILNFPANFQAHFLLGLAYRDKGADDLALEEFRIAEQINPKHEELAQEMAYLLLDQGDLEEAKKRLLRTDLKSATNLANLGVIARRQNDYAQAEIYLQRGLEQEPDNPVFWAQLGDVLLAQQKDRKAVEAYKRALRYTPQDFEILFNLGTLLLDLDETKQARRLLEQAVELSPDDGPANYNLALVLDEVKDLSEAQIYYLKALDRGVESAHAHFRLTFLHARQGDKEAALQHLEQAFEKDAETYVRLVADELLKVSSELDRIRYTDQFNRLLEQYWTRMK